MLCVMLVDLCRKTYIVRTSLLLLFVSLKQPPHYCGAKLTYCCNYIYLVPINTAVRRERGKALVNRRTGYTPVLLFVIKTYHALINRLVYTSLVVLALQQPDKHQRGFKSHNVH